MIKRISSHHLEICEEFSLSEIKELENLILGSKSNALNISIPNTTKITTPALSTVSCLVAKAKLKNPNLTLEIKDVSSLNQLKNALPDSQIIKPEDLFFKIGKHSYQIYHEAYSIASFIKQVFIEMILATSTNKGFRKKEIASQIDQTGYFATSIVCLVTFLIGVVIAYLMGNQLQYYGANILVVDGVAITMCRELSPILVAIVVAGRSGSAFAAELGSMKLNQETEALEVMGLSPYQILVLPRIIALMITLPFLVILGDIFGILGGMFISNLHLDIGYENFIERLHIILKPRQVFVGLIKAPFFALFIASIGCKLGLESLPNAVSIGRNTTKTVVQSIVSVILLNAAAAIIFSKIGL